MGSNEMASVASMLAQTSVKHVNELSFAGRKMKLDTREDAREIVEEIKNFKDLQALRLEGNTLGLEAATVIAEALSEKKEFERALWSDMYTGRLRSEIPPSLEHLGNGIIKAGAHLVELDLSDNAFGPDGVKGIKKLLVSEPCYTLHTLKLNNNGLGIGGGKILSEAFIECHKSSVKAGKPFALKVFISGRNRLENDGAKALSEAFKILGSLEKIEMPQNGIRPEGVEYLASAFKENKNLKVVNINDNTCTESGAKALAKCLPHLQKLEILNVGDCLLKDSGAIVLAPALAVEMPCLKEVIMSFNEIRRDGALAIAGSMKNKDNLELLNLDGNQLGDSTDDVQDLMTNIGRLDALGPFEDNEEPDDDEDDEASDDDGKAGENDDDDDETNDLSLQIKGIGLAKTSPLLNDSSKIKPDDTKKSSVDDARQFIRNPTPEGWLQLSRDVRKQLLETVIREDLLPSEEKVSYAYVQASFTLADHPEQVADFADCILGTAFSHSQCSSDKLILNLLIYMGLLKAETKVETVSNLKGPLHGLASIVKEKYFPPEVSQTFIAFLMKPNILLDSCPKERHNVLQNLYQK